MLFQGVGELPVPCLNLLKEANVLDRDCGLTGKCREQIDLFSREWSHFQPSDTNDADGFVCPHDWNCETCPKSVADGKTMTKWELILRCSEIVDMYGTPVQDCATPRPVALEGQSTYRQ